MDIFPQMVFGTLRPRIVLITTPNFEVRGGLASSWVISLTQLHFCSSTASFRVQWMTIRLTSMPRRDSSILPEGRSACSGWASLRSRTIPIFITPLLTAFGPQV